MNSISEIPACRIYYLFRAAARRKMAPANGRGLIVFQLGALYHHPRLRGFCAFLGMPFVGGAVRD